MRYLKALIPLATSLICSTGCPRVREIRIPVAAECDPGPAPERPVVTWRKCGADVCLSPEDGLKLWTHERAVDRWATLVQVCTDTKDSP